MQQYLLIQHAVHHAFKILPDNAALVLAPVRAEVDNLVDDPRVVQLLVVASPPPATIRFPSRTLSVVGDR